MTDVNKRGDPGTWNMYTYLNTVHTRYKEGQLNFLKNTQNTPHAEVSGDLRYFQKPHWFSMGLLEISKVTWQVCP